MTPELIPLDRAVVCEDCRRVSASVGPCDGCGSSAVFNLASVLEREPQESAGDEARTRSIRALAREALLHYRERRALDNARVVERMGALVATAEEHARPGLQRVP